MLPWLACLWAYAAAGTNRRHTQGLPGMRKGIFKGKIRHIKELQGMCKLHRCRRTWGIPQPQHLIYPFPSRARLCPCLRRSGPGSGECTALFRAQLWHSFVQGTALFRAQLCSGHSFVQCTALFRAQLWHSFAQGTALFRAQLCSVHSFVQCTALFRAQLCSVRSFGTDL